MTNNVFILTVEHFSLTELKQVSERKVAFVDINKLLDFVTDHQKENITNFQFQEHTNSSLINYEKNLIIRYTYEQIYYYKKV